MSRDRLVFFVNGRKVTEDHADPETTLLQYLRNKLHLTGTKLGCAEGGCGACTVMISRYDRQKKKIFANACLLPVCAVHGLAVITVEGIGNISDGLHPVQERLAKAHGSQCGFCTPGIIMSMYTLLRNNPQPSVHMMENAFQGNLCRCTGYRPILEGFRTFTKEYACGMGDRCCRVKNKNKNNEVDAELFTKKEFLPYDPSQEPLFPPELQNTDQYDVDNLVFQGEHVTWYRPVTLTELLELKIRFPEARLVCGNTEVGVEVKFKNARYPVMIHVKQISDLSAVEFTDEGLKVGAATTLTTLNDILEEAVQQLTEHKTRIFVAIKEMLHWFAGDQIRNVASVGGNIATASPISDLNPLFMAAGVILEVASKVNGKRKLIMDGTFFKKYRVTALKEDEVILSLTIPFSSEGEYFHSYKQSHRREDDIAIVNAAMRVRFEDNTNVIKKMSLCFGGMQPTSSLAKNAVKYAVGKKWEDCLVSKMSDWLAEDFPLSPDVPGGMASYRQTLCSSFFFKFYVMVQMQLQKTLVVGPGKVPSSFRSVGGTLHRDSSSSFQLYEVVAPGQLKEDLVGRPIIHQAALKQASGEAVYVDDMPLHANELYLTLVTSVVAHGRIISVDASDALALPGVVDYIDHSDVPGTKYWGIVVQDEPIFAVDKVTCHGQIIGAIIADSQTHAQRAAKMVNVKYEELEPFITIQQAINMKSFHQEPLVVLNGDVEAGFRMSDQIIEGQIEIGGQEHFYLETHVALAVPKNEDGEMEVYTNTQNITQTQNSIAAALNVACNKIVCRTKRVGGGFGGKESRTPLVCLPVAIAAYKHKRPVRCMLDRDEDMMISGTRHPFLGIYKVGFTNKGKILALHLKLYSNAGNTIDLSHSVMHRAILHCDNAYKIPNVHITGYLCKTNIPSNTAFRGFGCPQAMFVAETWISEIAAVLCIPDYEIRAINLYKNEDVTYFGQLFDSCNLTRCWDECILHSNFHHRRREVDIFNSNNRWKKRGLEIIPTKYGIGFGALFLNQAGALVNVYLDGSVLIAHGGVEMGQGLHTKMIQVASRVLRIPVSKIHISETSSNTVPNASATAASMGSDLYGMAVMRACQTILERLTPYMTDNPKGSWIDWVKECYMNSVCLSAVGFYRTEGIHFDFNTNHGNIYSYFSYGVGCSEVEIDCLTGDHQVLRTDIVMDVGSSLNPAIDIGQIEGAFMQGYGLMMMEQQKMSTKGVLYTRGPGAYKIPSCGDIPMKFNVSLLKESLNQRAVYSSKAIGEPPLFLAASVFFAVKNAITSARQDFDLRDRFQLNSPATPERIRMNCQDQFTKKFPQAEQGSYTPWFLQP